MSKQILSLISQSDRVCQRPSDVKTDIISDISVSLIESVKGLQMSKQILSLISQLV